MVPLPDASTAIRIARNLPVGFGRAATAGTGVGLANIRERLKLLYGNAAEVRNAENKPAGTRVTIVVPYRTQNNTEHA